MELWKNKNVSFSILLLKISREARGLANVIAKQIELCWLPCPSFSGLFYPSPAKQEAGFPATKSVSRIISR